MKYRAVETKYGLFKVQMSWFGIFWIDRYGGSKLYETAEPAILEAGDCNRVWRDIKFEQKVKRQNMKVKRVLKESLPP